MKKNLRKLLSVLISLLGTFLMLYIGGYWMFLRPIYFLFTGFTQGTLTAHTLFNCLIRLFLCMTVSGAIWCIFDILAGFFRDDENDD